MAVIGAIGLVILSMWIFWTPISYQYIAGVQGRYFIVTMLPVFMMFRNNRLSLKNDLGNKGIIAICVLVVLPYLKYGQGLQVKFLTKMMTIRQISGIISKV